MSHVQNTGPLKDTIEINLIINKKKISFVETVRVSFHLAFTENKNSYINLTHKITYRQFERILFKICGKLIRYYFNKQYINEVFD